jgi:hypothetical protein
MAGMVGLVAFVIAIGLIVLLAITICGALLVALLLVLAGLFGFTALGAGVGQRLQTVLDREFTPVVSVGLGTWVAAVVLGIVEQYVPCLGPLISIVVHSTVLGAAVLTRFGTQGYPKVEADLV